MKARDVLMLNGWVKTNRTAIIRDKKNRGQLCDAAARELEFKVSDSAMKATLVDNDITTKNISKHQREVQVLEEEIQMLRALLVKVVTSSNVPDWLRKELLTVEDLNEEVKAALQIEPKMALV